MVFYKVFHCFQLCFMTSHCGPTDADHFIHSTSGNMCYPDGDIKFPMVVCQQSTFVVLLCQLMEVVFHLQ